MKNKTNILSDKNWRNKIGWNCFVKKTTEKYARFCLQAQTFFVLHPIRDVINKFSIYTHIYDQREMLVVIHNDNNSHSNILKLDQIDQCNRKCVGYCKARGSTFQFGQ